MSRLPYIDASPNKAASNSIAPVRAFLERHRQARRQDERA